MLSQLYTLIRFWHLFPPGLPPPESVHRDADAFVTDNRGFLADALRSQVTFHCSIAWLRSFWPGTRGKSDPHSSGWAMVSVQLYVPQQTNPVNNEGLHTKQRYCTYEGVPRNSIGTIEQHDVAMVSPWHNQWHCNTTIVYILRSAESNWITTAEHSFI